MTGMPYGCPYLTSWAVQKDEGGLPIVARQGRKCIYLFCDFRVLELSFDQDNWRMVWRLLCDNRNVRGLRHMLSKQESKAERQQVFHWEPRRYS